MFPLVIIVERLIKPFLPAIMVLVVVLLAFLWFYQAGIRNATMVIEERSRTETIKKLEDGNAAVSTYRDNGGAVERLRNGAY